MDHGSRCINVVRFLKVDYFYNKMIARGLINCLVDYAKGSFTYPFTKMRDIFEKRALCRI